MKKGSDILDGPIDPENIPVDRAKLAQSAAEEAFSNSDGYSFGGERLKPFSIERQAAAQRLGLRYGSLDSGSVKNVPVDVPVESLGKKAKGAKKGGSVRAYYINYEGMLDDCILVLFLCTLEPERIVMIRGEDRTAQFWTEAYEWAERVGISYLNTKHGAAFVLFRTMMTDIQKTAVTVDREQGKARESETGN